MSEKRRCIHGRTERQVCAKCNAMDAPQPASASRAATDGYNANGGNLHAYRPAPVRDPAPPGRTAFRMTTGLADGA